jgi:hypothetical protein
VIQFSDWARDLLLSRGALVESEGDAALRALLPPQVSRVLAVGDWLSLDFGPRTGADDPGEWMERLSALLPPSPAIAGARLRQRTSAGRIDAEAVLNRELAVQNGVWRLMEDYASIATYYLFSFQYTVESDERTSGYLCVCLNTAARSISRQPERLLRALQDDLEEDPVFSPNAEEISAQYALAACFAHAEVRRLIAALEHSANRRLARDSARTEAYYGALMAQIEKRAVRRSADGAAAEKDRGRIEATQLDRAAKQEDLIRKYSLRVQIELTDVLVVPLPVRTISVRLIRKKEERLVALGWNGVLRTLDTPLCEQCSGYARPLLLCEKVHLLCATCLGPCPACGRVFCRICQPKCKCGAASDSTPCR